MADYSEEPGCLLAQLLTHPTLASGSGQDFRVVRSSSASGSVLNAESAQDSFPLLLPLPLALSLSCSDK